MKSDVVVWIGSKTHDNVIRTKKSLSMLTLALDTNAMAMLALLCMPPES